jgi:hypothetical protein
MMLSSSMLKTKAVPVGAPSNRRRAVAAKAGKYDEELIQTAVRFVIRSAHLSEGSCWLTGGGTASSNATANCRPQFDQNARCICC